MKPIFSALLLSVLLLLQACTQQDNFIFSHRFETACWTISDTLDFSLIKENGNAGRLLIDLNEEYPYQNLYLKLLYEAADGQRGEVLLGDTLSSPSGEWYIERKGGYYRGYFAEPLNLKGPDGTYTCRLIQYMREERLCGIRQIALREEARE